MLNHPESKGLLAAFITEYNSWSYNGCVIPLDCDPSQLDPSLIGDLMILWDIKYKPDGSFDKYKCRIVFRGDKWTNIHNLDTYASSADLKGFLIFLSLAATMDYDLGHLMLKLRF
jgi:hypothetical protein